MQHHWPHENFLFNTATSILLISDHKVLGRGGGGGGGA